MMTFIKRYYPVLIILIFCLFQLKSLGNSFWPRSHDGIYHAIRIKEFYQELTHGQFPVRWVDNLDNHFGIPLFNYIYPGPYLLAAIPMSLGFSEIVSYKLIMFLAYFLGVVGIYAIFSSRQKIIALLVSLLFALTPYLFLDIFVRGALGEVVAIAFMPWAIYGFNRRQNLISTLSLFFILLSHNFLGLLFLIFIVVKLIWEKNINKIAIRNIILALGLSAFFIIPMILERKYINSGLNNNFTFDYRQHFLYPIQLIYGKWDYWYSNPGPVDGMSFQLGFANTLIIILSLISLFFIKNKRNLIFLIFVVMFTIFLTLGYSEIVWQLIPPLQALQFPWRLLFIPLLICPLILFEIFLNIPKLNLYIKYVSVIFLIVLALFNVRNYRRPMEQINFQKYQKIYLDESQKTTTSSRAEISPIWSPLPKKNASRVIIQKTGQEIPVGLKPNSLSFTINESPATTEIIIYKNYFPGWRLVNIKNNQDFPTNPDQDGNVTAIIPNGHYLYKYGQTKIENISNLISISSFGLLLLISIRQLFLKKYGKI